MPASVSGEMPEITVLLSDKFGKTYKPFYCVICGSIVFEYNEHFIRSIVPSGRPQIDKPGKIYKCSGTLQSIHSQGQIYDVLYQVMDTVFNLNTMTEVRATLGALNQASEDKFTARCKARYYVS